MFRNYLNLSTRGTRESRTRLLISRLKILFTDDYYDYVGTFEYRWTRGLILDSTYKLPNKTYDSRSSKHPFADCTKALPLPDHEQGNIDPYNILLVLGPVKKYFTTT
ncbi:hypothetical protein FXO38_33556 [Capsicum annuum]|nr:hypothetical protein FXO38_33556 [Capsicum annuum]KAF3621766.1 hypothetical protein FXO37_32611 [Capsicum annuum]